MPKEFTSTTFTDVYKDDYSDSDGYHRILFNSGLPLQARELTQLQSIIQQQIKRFGDNVFLDGAAVGSSGSGVSTVSYVQLKDVSVPIENYVGVTLQGPSSDVTSGLQFYVIRAEEGTESDPPTLFGTYISSNQSAANIDVQPTTPTFTDKDLLQDIRVISGQEGTPELVVRTQRASSNIQSTGRGLLFGIKSSNFWTQGHFVFTAKQLLTISKYTTTADVDVGFEVIEDIVTVEDDPALYDNQGAVPNLSSPGADRYRIKLKLSTRDEVSDPTRFIYFASVRDGEVTQTSGGSSSYNEIERRMAIRTNDTNGDFIANSFDIRFLPGADKDHIDLVIPGMNNKGGNPVAFVDGFRLEHFNDKTFSIPKPTSVTSELGQATPITYKNYINVPFDTPEENFMGKFSNNLIVGTQTKVVLIKIDSQGNRDVIGDARIKHIVNTLDPLEGYRIHLYDMKMYEGQNARDVREFAPYDDQSSGVPVTLNSGQMYVRGAETNTTIHKVAGGRVQSISGLNYTVQRQFGATTNADGELQITTRTNESFDDLSRWVFIDVTTGAEERVLPGNITLNSATPQTATCKVSSWNSNYTVFAYVEKNFTNPKTKTFTVQSTHVGSTLIDDQDGKRFEFGLYDGVSLIEARANNSSGELITDLVKFDGGQRDNFYGPVTLKPSGLPASITTIYAKFEYFTWGSTGDYFSVNSYVLDDSFGYVDIPTFTSPRTGSDYSMRNHIDFRPKLDPSSGVMEAKDRFEVPRDGDNVTYDVDWYNLRVDVVALGYNPNNFKAEIRINTGVEELDPSQPTDKQGEMSLFSVRYRGNTLDIKDIDVTKSRHRRYKMTDIAKLDDRVGLLEETVSLSFLEQEASNLVELNSNGEVRSKTGFFVDDFKKGWNFTAGMLETQRSMDDALQTENLIYTNMLKKEVAVSARSKIETTQILLDSDNLYVDRSSVVKEDVVRKGDIVYIDYKEVLDSSMTNEVISWFSDGRSSEEEGWYNVNPYNVFSGQGFLKLSPATDTWVDTYHLEDMTVVDEEMSIDAQGNETITSGGGSNTRSGSPVGPSVRGAPQGNPPGMTVTYKPGPQPPAEPAGPSGYWETVSSESVYEVVRDITEDSIAYSVPFARQREVFGKVQGLRPNTRYWPFFDNINVEQWSIGETEAEYKEHLRIGDHLRGYPSVDVTILQHPRKFSSLDATLISDYKGELFFSFWLPNNAPVPSANGNEFGSFDEWESWVENQRKEAEKYPSGATDPQVYNDIGWKFRTGSVPFFLNDVSTNVASEGLSNARSTYVSSGSLSVTQKTIHMTRVTETTETQEWVDPIAQSIMIDGRDGVPGAFVTKIDVFMRRAPQSTTNGGTDLAIPLQMQIREMENGYPVGYPAGEQFRVYKPADEVYEVISQITNKEDIDDVLSHPVTFEFPEPVYLEANIEYAVVLLAECDNYEVFVSTTYGLLLGDTEKRVNKQPALGSLFLSQNGSTWTAKQDQNLAYRIYTAKFKSKGTFNMYNDDFGKFNHNTPRMEIDSNDTSRYRVNHIAHGLGVGDKVGLLGLDSADDYFGVSGATLMGPDLVVDSADTAGYFVQLPESFSQPAGRFGALEARTNQAFNFDNAFYVGLSQQYSKTRIENEVSFISGVSHSKINMTNTADPRFDFSGRNVKMSPGTKMNFNEPKMLANPQLELDEIYPQGELAPSIVIGRTLITESTSTFGGPAAAAIRSEGYVSDVSPIVDLQRSMMLMVNHIIDNQPLDAASASELTNAPSHYVPETDPIMGSSPSKHLIKPVVLGSAANGIRVFIDAYRTLASDFDVYYRTTADPDGDIYEQSFTLIAAENEVPVPAFNAETFSRSSIDFKEFRYLIGGVDGDLDDFTKFQIKIVMKSTNTCEVPIIKSIRTIALI